MRKIWLVIVVAIPLNIFGQQHLPAGQGILKIDLSQKPVFKLYQDTADATPARIIQIVPDSAGELMIKSATPPGEWLDPEQLFLNYDILSFRADTRSGNWIRIFTHNGKAQTMWVKVAPYLGYVPWATLFTKHTSSIEPVEGTALPVHVAASDKSKSIRSTMPGECFQVKEVKGEWMRIETGAECGGSSSRIRSGWIRWKKQNRLLITYSAIA